MFQIIFFKKVRKTVNNVIKISIIVLNAIIIIFYKFLKIQIKIIHAKLNVIKDIMLTYRTIVKSVRNLYYKLYNDIQII